MKINIKSILVVITCSLVTNKRYNLQGNKLHQWWCYSNKDPNKDLRNSPSSTKIKPLMLKFMTGKFQEHHQLSDFLQAQLYALISLSQANCKIIVFHPECMHSVMKTWIYLKYLESIFQREVFMFSLSNVVHIYALLQVIWTDPEFPDTHSHLCRPPVQHTKPLTQTGEGNVSCAKLRSTQTLPWSTASVPEAGNLRYKV